MHCHRILVSALFVDMSSLLTSFLSNKYFLLSLVDFILSAGSFEGDINSPLVLV